ncbi:MAG TPA: integrin alpha [bacterium]|nr:integrin alpha [bacterium]
MKTLTLIGMLISIIASEAYAGSGPLLPLLPGMKPVAADATPKGAAETEGMGVPYPSPLLYRKNGDADTVLMGYSVDGGADVNGDGVPDFIVGAPLASPNGVINAGSAHVYSGLDGSLLYQINGTDSAEVVGVSVAMLGDVNGDARADFLVGAPYADPGGLTDAGSVYLYSGMNGILLQQKDGGAADDNFGWSVARAGNVNADAIPDYVVGAPYADSGAAQSAGNVYVYSGAGGGLLHRKYGDSMYVNLGLSVAGAGDVNADGRADFMAGAPYGGSGRGAAYVYSGLTGAILHYVTGDSIGANLGQSIAGMGDVNGDGYRDFIVGAPYYRNYTGAAYVFSGFDGALLRRFDGMPGSSFGYAVAPADVNGDGLNDAMITAPGTEVGGLMQAGATMIYSLKDGAILHHSLGSQQLGLYGFHVARMGDVNGDGRDEFLIGEPRATVNTDLLAGSAYALMWGASEEITMLADIPNDQGKQMRIQWSDIPANDGFIQEFAIYRRVDGNLSSKSVDPYARKSTPPGVWDFVMSVPARGDSLYSTVVPTLRDSTIADGMWWTVFFVSGIGENPVDHFDSPVDSGYSLDNLAPAPPTNLIAAFSGSDVDLDWKSSATADFDYYRVYRDTVPGFALDPNKVIGETSDTSFVDSNAPSAAAVYYRVSAVDFSGNEGSPSNEASPSSCPCNCAADPACDGVTDVFDVTHAVNVAFRNAAPIGDSNPLCPYTTTDVDCNGVTNIFDVTHLVNVAFRNANAAVEFCNPCP